MKEEHSDVVTQGRLFLTYREIVRREVGDKEAANVRVARAKAAHTHVSHTLHLNGVLVRFAAHVPIPHSTRDGAARTHAHVCRGLGRGDRQRMVREPGERAAGVFIC